MAERQNDSSFGFRRSFRCARFAVEDLSLVFGCLKIGELTLIITVPEITSVHLIQKKKMS